LCSLARAIIEFNKGHVKESLVQLKTMVKENPRAPSDIWFAIGLCYFRLGNLPKAKLSMDRTIQDDPHNSMALTALGVIEIAANATDYESREKAYAHFEQAFAANPRNPLCLKYLAEHFFLIEQYEQCKELV
jgi:RNA polymerase-associated protein CTR9